MHAQEFFALLSFVAPDLLGSPQAFKRVRSLALAPCTVAAAATRAQKISMLVQTQCHCFLLPTPQVYSEPIAKAQDRAATPAERELGAARAACVRVRVWLVPARGRRLARSLALPPAAAPQLAQSMRARVHACRRPPLHALCTRTPVTAGS